MADSAEPLKEGDSGTYSELRARPNPGDLYLVFIPSLSALLERAAQLKADHLTPREKAMIVQVSEVVVMSSAACRAIESNRGYADEDPAEILRDASCD